MSILGGRFEARTVPRDHHDRQSCPSSGARPQRGADRRDVPPVPGRSGGGRARVAGVLRGLRAPRPGRGSRLDTCTGTCPCTRIARTGSRTRGTGGTGTGTGEERARARRARRRGTRAAPRRRRPHRHEHGGEPPGTDRHVSADGARQVARGQPADPQQSPRPHARRQGLVHPPHRLRGAARAASSSPP